LQHFLQLKKLLRAARKAFTGKPFEKLLTKYPHRKAFKTSKFAESL